MSSRIPLFVYIKLKLMKWLPLLANCVSLAGEILGCGRLDTWRHRKATFIAWRSEPHGCIQTKPFTFRVNSNPSNSLVYLVKFLVMSFVLVLLLWPAMYKSKQNYQTIWLQIPPKLPFQLETTGLGEFRQKSGQAEEQEPSCKVKLEDFISLQWYFQEGRSPPELLSI